MNLTVERRDKKDRIEQSAMKLFLENGIENTSVSQITHYAQIAKGTFYLYFKDKNELVEQTLLTEKIRLLDHALQRAKEASMAENIPWVTCFCKELSAFFYTHPQVLTFIYQNKNLLLFEQFVRSEHCEHQSKWIKDFILNLSADISVKDALYTRFTILVDVLTTTCFLYLQQHSPASPISLSAFINEVLSSLYQRHSSKGA